MVGTDYLPAVPPVKDRVGSTKREAISAIPGKESLFKGRGNIFLFHYANFKIRTSLPGGVWATLSVVTSEGHSTPLFVLSSAPHRQRPLY
jgi:hypothetical protein